MSWHNLLSEEEAAFEAIRERQIIFKDRKQATKTQNRPMMPLAVRGKISYDLNVYEPGDASNAGAYVALKTGAAS